MPFISRKIEEKTDPFLKKGFSKSSKPQVFFGPETTKISQKKSIFSKNLFIWLVVSFFILFYLFLGLKKIFSQPEIIVYFPPNNYVTQERMITVKGKVNDNVTVTINNQPITLKENSFEEKISLSEGINIIKISARKKFGLEKIIFRQIVVK